MKNKPASAWLKLVGCNKHSTSHSGAAVHRIVMHHSSCRKKFSFYKNMMLKNIDNFSFTYFHGNFKIKKLRTY